MQFPFFQNWLSQRAADFFSKEIGTEVTVEKVGFSIFNRVEVDGLLIKDKQKDTLLYAGNAKSSFTDFFFLKDEVLINSIQLSNVEVNLLRKTDSVWNYQYLLDKYGSKGPSSGKKSKPISLSNIIAKNLKLRQLDNWLGNEIIGTINDFNFIADSFDFENQKIAINSLKITDPYFSSNVINALKVKDTITKKSNTAVINKNTKKPWEVICKELIIRNGQYINNTNLQEAKVNKFDGRHIALDKFNIKLENTEFKNNELQTKIIEASAKERCGFEIEKLKGDLVYNKTSIALDNAFIKTPNSEIKKYAKLSGEDIISDFNDVVNKVTFNTDFETSYISPIDIAYFANGLPNGMQTVYIDGQVTGKINNLVGKSIIASTGTVTRIIGDIDLLNITDKNKFEIKITNGKVTTKQADIAVFYAPINKLTKPNINALGIVNFEGNATIRAKKYIANGNLSTALGNLNINGNFNNENITPSYSGTLLTNSFALGRFLNDAKLGELQIDGKIDGKGSNLDNLLATVNGNVKKIIYNGNIYENLSVDATIKDKVIAGSFSSNNEYLKGATSFSYNFGGNNDIEINSKQFFVNLQKILSLPKPFTIGGNGKISLSGKSIDEMTGTIDLTDATIISNNKKLNFNRLQVKSFKNGDGKNLEIKTDELDGNVRGDFLLSKLPQTFQSFLYRYYPNLIKKDASLPKNQNFTFDITTRNVGEIAKGYIDNVEGLDNGTILGNINTSNISPSLHTEIFMPYVAFKKYKASNLSLISDGDYDSLKTTINIGEFYADSLLIPDSKITIASSNDISEVILQTTTNSSLEKALLQAQIHTLSDGVDILFKKSNFLINNKTWTIEEGGTLSLSKTNINNSRVKIYEGIQEIEITTGLGSLDVNFKHINIGDYTPFILKTETLEGDLTGSISIENPLGNIHVSSQDLIINEFRFNNDSIGIFKIDNFDYLKSSNNILFKTSSENENYAFKTDGTINLKNQDNLLDINLDIDKLSLTILNKYLKGVFYDIKGFGQGKGRIYGSNKKQFVNGDITTKQAGLGVNFTKCYYYIKDNQPISFTNTGIDFGSLVLVDNDKNNKGQPREAILTGSLKHNFFKNFYYDFHLSSANKVKGIQLLNTTEADNTQFYGYAVGNADVSFTGPEYNMKLMVDNIEATEQSNLTLPDEASLSSGLGELIKIRESSKLQEERKPKTQSNLDIVIIAKATPLAKIKLIIDSESGDAIDVRGNGFISMTSGSRAPLTLSGTYIIGDSSNYTFSINSDLLFNAALNFKIKPGGTINWTNNPYDAQIDITANYETKQISLSDLNPGGSGNSPFEQGLKSRINVSANLTQSLFKPNIKLGLDIIDNIDARYIELFSQIKNDSVEVLRQASTVILLNRFFPIGNSNNNAGNNANLVNGATNKLLNTLTGQITNEFSRFINQKIFASLGINFDAGASFDGSGLVRQGGNPLTSAYFKLSKNLFKDRIVFHFDSDIDFETVTRLQNSGSTFLPNFYLDFVLSKAKELKLTIYYKSILDLNRDQQRRMGATVRRSWSF